MMSNKPIKPWEALPSCWKTEAAFWNFVKGVLRKGWNFHPIKLEYIKRNRKLIKNPNPKGKKEYVYGMTCQQCGKDFVQSDIQIDHKEGHTTLTKEEDIQSAAAHLLIVNFQSLRELCKGCHGIISYSNEHNISFVDAAIQKKVIQTLKDKKKTLEILSENGYTGDLVSNDAKRRELLIKIFGGGGDHEGKK